MTMYFKGHHADKKDDVKAKGDGLQTYAIFQKGYKYGGGFTHLGMCEPKYSGEVQPHSQKFTNADMLLSLKKYPA